MRLRIALLILFALTGVTLARAQATLRLSADSPLYDHLEHFRALGLWSGSLEARPVSRGAVCDAVQEISARAATLSGGDLMRLETLTSYCEAQDVDALSRLGRKVEGEAAGAGAGHAPARWEPSARLQFFGVHSGLDSLADLDRRPRRDGLVHLGLDAEIAGELSAQLSFYEDYSRLTPRPGDGDWVDNLPPDAGGITSDPSARLDRAVIAYHRGWWELRLGREDRRLGAGRHGSLFLSENPFPLDGIAFLFETRYLSGASLFAQTRRPAEAAPLDADRQDAAPDGAAYLAAHRFELRPPGPLTLGFFEAVAYGGRGIDLAYVNPVGFLLAMSQDIWDRSGADDKKELGLDFRLDLPPVTLYGEFLLDRLVVLDAADAKEEPEISSFAQLLGLRWANPLGLAGADLDLEYAHLDPQVYFHWNGDTRRDFVTDDRFGEGRLLGHWLGPNADCLLARLSLPPSRRWGGLTLHFEQARWGLVEGLRGSEIGFFGLEKEDKEWLTGDVATERVLSLSWERRSNPEFLPGILDTSLILARIERSGAWDEDAWQLELRLDWRWRTRWRG